MKAFYGSRFSPNMTKTPEGFLICHNVPIARTGEYKYLGKELGIKDRYNEIIKIYRNPEEVFSKKAIASFEGKIVTDEHPSDLLTSENAQRYSKGSIQNVRKSNENDDLLLADLFLYDKKLINEVLDGKREVSCGYDCVYVDNGDGTFNQTEIRGNHVAVVESGRAGRLVSIKDSNKEMKGENKNMSKMKMPKKRGPITDILIACGLKNYSADAEPEEIADTLDGLMEERLNNDNGEEIQQEEKKVQTQQSNDEGGENSQIASLAQQVSKLTDIVMQLANPKEKAPEEAIDALINELKKDSCNDEGSETIEMDADNTESESQNSDNETENVVSNTDSLATIKALNAIKPVIANISDVKERKKACDSLIAEFKKINAKKSHSNGYADVLKSQRQHAKDAQSKRRKTADEKAKEYEELGDKIAKKYNSNLKEEK